MSKLSELTVAVIEGSRKTSALTLQTVEIDGSDAARIARYLLSRGYRKVEYPNPEAEGSE